MKAKGKKQKQNTHAVEKQRLTKHTPAVKRSRVSPLPLLRSLSYSTNAHLPTSQLHEKHGRAEDVEAVPFHSTSGSDQRASWKLRPLGLLITMLLNSGSDSSQRMSLCLLNTKVPTSLRPSPLPRENNSHF